MAISQSKMSSAELLRHLKKKMGSVSDNDLAARLGIKLGTLTHWRKETTSLTPLQVARVLDKAQRTARSQVHSDAIRPIVEFFPIDSVAVGRLEKKPAVFPTGEESGKHYAGLHAELLAAKSGLYIFYDTRGCALYAGQTKKQNIWKELNLAFNRKRSAQVMTLVRHPERDVEFRSAHTKVRQPTDVVLKLHDLAAYFSAYEVIPEMVDDLEALLVRAFPNDLLNFKMEKFGKAARKAVKKVAPKQPAKKAARK
jgi:hypothetical protein